MPSNHSINRERVRVIRENRWLPLWYAFGLALVLIAIPAATLYVTRLQLGEDYRLLQEQMERVQEEQASLQQRIDGLLQERADLEVASQLDRAALQQLRSRLVEWREANELLEEQTQFYMSLMNPTATNAGVFIESIEIRATSTPNRYDYDVLVAQRTLDHQGVTGRLVINLIGRQNGSPLTLTSDTLGLDNNGQALGFRYFQHLTGSLEVPAGFAAEQLRARVYLAGNNTPLLDETTAWPSSNTTN